MTESKMRPSKLSGLSELLASSAIWGAIPLIAVFSGGKQNPLLFVAIWSSSGALGLYIYLRYLSNWRLSKKSFTAALRSFLSMQPWGRGNRSIFNIFEERSILIPLQGLEYLILAWSFRYVNETVGAIIFESWPVFFAILMRKLNKKYSITRRSLLFSVLAFLAVGFVVASNTSTQTGSVATSTGYIFGIFVLLFSIILTLQDATRLKQAESVVRISHKEQEETGQHEDEFGQFKKEFEHTVIALNMLSLILSAIIGFLSLAILLTFNLFNSFTSTLSLAQILILSLTSTAVTIGGTVLNTRGNIKGEDLRVQSVRYFTPVFAVIFVVMLYPIREVLNSIGSEVSLSSDIIWPWLVVGLLGVFTANILTNLESEIGAFGLTSFVVSLWLSGVLVYFRDEFSWWVRQVENFRADTLEYYAFLGVSATVFALLIAFQVTRLEQRASKEQDTMFWLLSRFENLKHLYGKPQKSLELLAKEKDIDKIQEHYMDIRRELCILPDVDPEIPNKLNQLICSRQYGFTMSGRVAIIALALFSIALTLGLRPSNIEGLSAVFVDSFALILSAVMAYLTFHLFDLRNTRVKGSIERYPSSHSYVLGFVSTSTRHEASIAIPLILVNAVTYIILYAFKWLL